MTWLTKKTLIYFLPLFSLADKGSKCRNTNMTYFSMIETCFWIRAKFFKIRHIFQEYKNLSKALSHYISICKSFHMKSFNVDYLKGIKNRIMGI